LFEFLAFCDAEMRRSRFVTERGSRVAVCERCGHLLIARDGDPFAHATCTLYLRELLDDTA
jgi:hypothetical protein